MIVSSVQRGPIRTTFEVFGGALALFSRAERNRAKRLAGGRGGRYWLSVWMPRRFSGYAFLLGYRVSGRWLATKRRNGAGAVPFVGLTPSGGGPVAPGYKQVNGAKMADAIAGSSVSTSSDGERITIKVPYGHPIQTDKAEAFRRIPAHEVEAIAAEIGDELGRIISGATASHKRGGAVVYRLSSEHAKPRRVRGAA